MGVLACWMIPKKKEGLRGEKKMEKGTGIKQS